MVARMSKSPSRLALMPLVILSAVPHPDDLNRRIEGGVAMGMSARRDPNAIFRQVDADCYVAGDQAAGPWNVEFCHGGAPAALLAQIADESKSAVPMSIARVTIDLLNPVPVGTPLRLAQHKLREGKRLDLIALELLTGEKRLVRATILKVRGHAGAGSAEALEPDEAAHDPMPSRFASLFTIIPEKGGFERLQPASVWFRLNVPLLEGRATTPVAAMVAAADFGSGICAEFSYRDWAFPSLDLTVALARPPLGSWSRLDSQWLRCSEGRATCITQLADAYGPCAHAMQSVFLERRNVIDRQASRW